jgi:hypothetical protein
LPGKTENDFAEHRDQGVHYTDITPFDFVKSSPTEVRGLKAPVLGRLLGRRAA